MKVVFFLGLSGRTAEVIIRRRQDYNGRIGRWWRDSSSRRGPVLLLMRRKLKRLSWWRWDSIFESRGGRQRSWRWLGLLWIGEVAVRGSRFVVVVVVVVIVLVMVVVVMVVLAIVLFRIVVLIVLIIALFLLMVVIVSRGDRKRRRRSGGCSRHVVVEATWTAVTACQW